MNRSAPRPLGMLRWKWAVAMALSGSSLFFATITLFATVAAADSPLPHGALPVLSIAKSENKNQVQYVVRVDDQCAPVGSAPVFAYWRMLEQGPTKTTPILSREVSAYGIASQSILARDASGGQVRVVLNALRQRPITVVTSRGSDGVCLARAIASIAGASARIFNVYVRLRWYGIGYLLLRGWSMDGSHVVTEKVTT
jgi:hypothetical protein